MKKKKVRSNSTTLKKLSIYNLFFLIILTICSKTGEVSTDHVKSYFFNEIYDHIYDIC